MNLTPDRREVLRYLGYHNQTIDAATETLLHACIEQMQRSAKPRFTYRIFTLLHGAEDASLTLSECGLPLCGKDLAHHLRRCRKCAVLAVTLGVEADNLIRIAQKESMSRAVIFDACAADMVEKLCDLAEQEIAVSVSNEGLFLLPRFSPGYGDCPLTLQSDIGRILDTSRKIGLTVTDHCLMLPRKSVTALIGLSETAVKKAPPHCSSKCRMYGRCQYQREGITCGR